MEQKKTLQDYLNEYDHAAPDKKLLGDSRGWLTVRQTLRAVTGGAEKLAALGVRRGSRVALRMTQTREAVIGLLALQAVGAVAVLTGDRVPVTAFLAGVNLPRSPEFILSDESGAWKLEAAGGIHAEEPRLAPDAPAMVIFTSGSTGKSKGVILSQNNLICNLLDSAPLGGYEESDIALGALPMNHVFGLALLTGAIVLRHSLYLTAGADLETVLRTIGEQRVTRMNGVPSLYLNMAARKERYDLSSLRCGFIGGGPCTAEQFRRIERELDMTLVPVYGMSECVGISCGCHRDPQSLRENGVGRFYPMNEGAVLREDGSRCGTGEPGEVCVRGPMRFLGYCDEEETAAALDAEGFLHTGDLGYVDRAGVLHLSGRKKDIIIRNGINLSARKIEEALLGMPGVADAAVVGLPHDMQGEVPGAMAVTSLSEEALLESLGRSLQKNELPVCIRIVKAIPHTSSGKPDKVKIKELLRQ